MPSQLLKLSDLTAAEKWQQILADLITDPKELMHILELDPDKFNLSDQVLQAFPLKVPRPFLSRIEKGNSRCRTAARRGVNLELTPS